jgi:hypothetical protein
LIAGVSALILSASFKEVRMKKFVLAGIAALAIAGSTVVYAQHRPWFHEHMRMSPEDRAAFTDARIAAVRAGLKLTPDQDKLWPPVEAAVRDFAKLRMDRANARMAARQDDARKQDDAQKPDDPVARLRERADNMAATAAAMKKIADAAGPLYKTLDDGSANSIAIAMATIGVSTVTVAMIATAVRAGIMAAGTTPSGSDRTHFRRIES